VDEATEVPLRAPRALAEPVQPVQGGWVSLLFLANTALWMAVYAPLQVLLPEQVQSLHDHVATAKAVPSGTDAVLLSVVMATGAIGALLANPVIGALSDRTTSRWGRRHPWTVAGAVTGAVGIGVVAAAPAIPVMAVGWFIAQIGLGGMLATLTSALPDRVPVKQRGTLGALIGVSQMLGTVLGALVVTVVVSRMGAGYVTCAAILIIGAAVFVLWTPDEPLPREYKPATPLSAAIRWVSPREHPDFAWAWLTHFLINLGNALGTLYLLYFLAHGARYHDPQTGLLILMGLYALALLITGPTCGTLSDRSGRRKPYIIGSAVVMGIAAALLVASPTWSAALVAAPLLGAGFGTYWAAAPALLTEVLPAAADRAKDLGLINVAYNLPLVVGPLVAGVVLGLMNSYPALFAVAGIVTALAAGTVSRVRSVALAALPYTKSRSSGILDSNGDIVEVTPLAHRAFRSHRGLVGGLALLVAIGLAMIGLSACGAPSYTYVTDSADKAYFKVPTDWHPISQKSLDAALAAVGGSSAGIWATAFDDGQAPSGNHFLSFGVSRPFVFSEVGQLSSDASNALSYNSLRDFMLPVTSTQRQNAAASGSFPLTNFKQLRDNTITGKSGVHGVRETFEYTYNGATDAFDEDVLTNANQTVVYFLIVHCTDTCYSHYQSDINTVMSSFTVGSS
jgi:MFS family permease